MLGFALRRLTVCGSGVADAALEFEDGLNAIVGPSDTGKTYAVQCIDHALGRSRALRDIDEARAYETVLLEIESRADGRRHTLERALAGGHITLRSEGEEPEILRVGKPTKTQRTVSAFLLGLCGATDLAVTRLKKGTTRALTFRDLAHLAVIEEDGMMAERSPILSGQYTAKTVEESVFRLLMTGAGDGAVVSAPEPRVTATASGRRAVVTELLEGLSSELEVFEDLADERLAARSEELSAEVERSEAEVDATRDALSTASAERRVLWKEMSRVRAEVVTLDGLNHRFGLLEQQYRSDLQRLDAIIEAGGRLMDLEVQRCPVCGAEPGDQHHHVLEHGRPDSAADAAIAERDKVLHLLGQLEQTARATVEELATRRQEEEATVAALDRLDDRINSELQPMLGAEGKHLRQLLEQRAEVARHQDLLRRRATLVALIPPEEIADASDAETEPAASVGDADEFAGRVQELLTAWGFPGGDRVSFDSKAQDLVIGGKARQARGKGVRAITHAGFTFGLLGFCLDRGRPFPNFVVVDSPLVVYREPDPDEADFPLDIKTRFWESTATAFNAAQVIVFDNDPPPDDINARIIPFTSAAHGRRGFLGG